MMSRVISYRRRAARVSFGELRLAILLGLSLGLAAAAGFDPASRPAIAPQSPASAVTQRFDVCGGGRRDDCVVDGDTFRMAGAKIRIANIDTPETHPPRCAEEGALGRRATLRLAELLSEGAFTLESADRDEDRYGRKLRIVTRNGDSLGDVLVEEGLARRWEGHRRPWCEALV